MKRAVVGGVVLGSVVVAWTYVMGITGWYLDPEMLHLFWGVVLLQVAVLGVLLARTRSGRSYGAQVGAGMVASAVGAVFVFLGSLLFTMVLFPHYFEDLLALQERMMRAEGLPEETLSATLEEARASRTPTGHAFAGFMGTLGVGFIASLALAIGLHDRSAKRTSVSSENT
jgi:hypothetical protein